MTRQATIDQMTIDNAIRDLRTPGGKKLNVYHVPNTSLYRVAFNSGGERPNELDGMFTDTNRALEATHKYLRRAWEEARKEEEKYSEKHPVTSQRRGRKSSKNDEAGKASETE